MSAATDTAMQGDSGAPVGRFREFWGYFSANAGAVLGLVIVITVLLMALFAPLIAPYPPDLTNNAVFLKPPFWQDGGSLAYPLGTDAIGRDILSRLIHGARLSLVIGIAVVAISVLIGTVLGLTAGYFRGFYETAVMRLMDIVLTLPSLLLAIVIVAILGLRHGGSHERGRASAPDVQRNSAELCRAADRAGFAWHLDRDSRCRGARLSRSWRATASARVGHDARRCA